MGGGAAVEAAPEQEEFDVVLEGVGDKKIQVIKVIREITALGLKEAKALVDGAPNTVKEGITKDEADQIKAKLEDLGYDTMMLYVNTNLKTANRRNYERERTVPLSVLKKNWNVIQNNIGQFQGMFKGDFHVFDNSDETPDSKSKIQSFVKITRNFLEKPASKPQAVQFIKTKI